MNLAITNQRETLSMIMEIKELSDEEREQRKMMWILNQRLNAEGDTEGASVGAGVRNGHESNPFSVYAHSSFKFVNEIVKLLQENL